MTVENASDPAAAWRERLRALAESEQRDRETIVKEPSPTVVLRARDEERAREQEPLWIEPRPEPPVVEPARVPLAVTDVIAEVLRRLIDDEVTEAKDLWESVAHRDGAHPSWVLVGELVRVATFIKPALRTILAYAIRVDSLETVPPGLRAYTLDAPERAFWEAAVLKKYAPTIARLVGDELIPEEETDIERVLAEHEAAEDQKAPSKFASAFMMVLFLVVVFAMGVAIVMISKPGWKESSAPPVAKKSLSENGAVPSPIPISDVESREASLFAIRRSMDILAGRKWFGAPEAFDGVMEALVRGDCEVALGTVRSIDPTDAPDAAVEHLESIRMRVFGLCRAEKTAPTE